MRQEVIMPIMGPLRPWIGILAVNIGFVVGWATARVVAARDLAMRSAPIAHRTVRPIDTASLSVIPPPPPAPPPPAAPPAPPRPPASEESWSSNDLPTCPSLDRTVRRVAPDRYVIDRAALACHLSATSSLATSARFVPSFTNGTPHGIKVYAIRPSSMLGRMGIENGDRLIAIAGMPLTTPERCIQAYARLRQPTSPIVLDVERRGSRRRISYQIINVGRGSRGDFASYRTVNGGRGARGWNAEAVRPSLRQITAQR